MTPAQREVAFFVRRSIEYDAAAPLRNMVRNALSLWRYDTIDIPAAETDNVHTRMHTRKQIFTSSTNTSHQHF